MCMTLGNTIHNTLPPLSQVSHIPPAMTSGLVWCFFTWFRAAWILRNSRKKCPNFLSISFDLQFCEEVISLKHRFLCFKMRLKAMVCVINGLPLGVTEILQFMPSRPHQPPNVAGILNDLMGGFMVKHGRSGCLLRMMGVCNDNMLIWIYVKSVNHCRVTHSCQVCEPTSLCWGVKVSVSPAIGIV